MSELSEKNKAKLRLKDLSLKERLRVVWSAESSDELDYCKTLYYAARAIETYGLACRDNSFEQLVTIGKEIESEVEFE